MYNCGDDKHKLCLRTTQKFNLTIRTYTYKGGLEYKSQKRSLERCCGKRQIKASVERIYTLCSNVGYVKAMEVLGQES